LMVVHQRHSTNRRRFRWLDYAERRRGPLRKSSCLTWLCGII
jgi:hypothetical protein